MSRKALFANLKDPADQPNSEGGSLPAATEPIRASRSRMRPILGSADLMNDPSTAPVGALGQSLSEFKAKTDRAEKIEQKLAEGQAVVDLDPGDIEPSFVADRMPTSPQAHARLVDAIREHGQQVPILVRPHPEKPGRYQVAYGHRRLRALKELARPVKAVVKNLGDEELVIAQGQENNERQDLSYIEKARFAYRLQERGFRRDTIMTAMSVHKSDLSNMLAVIARVPEDIVDAIGAAASIGRRGWIALADDLAKKDEAERIRALVTSSEVQALDSDHRFKRIYAAVRPRTNRHRTESWTTSAGSKFAKITQDDERLSVTVDRRVVPEFGDFLLKRLRELYEEFEAGRSSQP